MAQNNWSYFNCNPVVCALQWMVSGRSGPSGHCVTPSVRDSDGGSATCRHLDTEARCVRETLRAQKTAQTGCVQKVSNAEWYHSQPIDRSMISALSSSPITHKIAGVILNILNMSWWFCFESVLIVCINACYPSQYLPHSCCDEKPLWFHLLNEKRNILQLKWSKTICH